MAELNPLTNKNTTISENAQPQTQAYHLAVILFGTGVLTVPFFLFVALQSRAWQMAILAAATIVLVPFNYSFMKMIKNGRLETGGWLLIYSTLSVMLLGSSLIAGLGTMVAASAIILSFIIASRTMPVSSMWRATALSVAAGLIYIFLDYINPAYRLSVPALQVYLPAIIVVIVLATITLIALEAWKRGLRNKLLITLFGNVTLLTLVFTGLRIYNAQTNIRTDENKSLNQLYSEYGYDVQALEESAALLSASLADREDIKLLYLADDREGLIKLLTPVFNTMRDEYNVRHLYIENLDGTVYLRVHKPENFGDDVTYRPTAATALTTRKTVAGVDIGPNRIGVRSVTPLIQDGKVIGMLEVGLDYDQEFIDALKKHTGADYTMWVSNAAAEPAGLKPLEGSPPSSNPDMFFYTSTLKTPVAIEREVYERVLQTGTAEILTVSTGSVDTAVLVAPMHGYADRIIGILEISQSLGTDQLRFRNEVTFALIIAVILLVLGTISTGFAGQILVLTPLKELSTVAQKQLEGDLTARSNLRTGDELEQLGRTLNTVSFQLNESLQELEQHVAARTYDLATVAEVGTITSTILETNRLLETVTNLTKERFNLYHSHIYLLDENGENLVLAAGAGEPGRIMTAEKRSIPIDREQSLVARAARERKGVVVNDVTKAPDFLPNPLLPNTRSELAVPMLVGNTLIGVFDIQSDVISRFTESDVNIQTTLASQLASSIQNARSFERSRAQVDQEMLVNTIGRKIQQTVSIEEALQTAIRELGVAVGAPRVMVSLGSSNRKAPARES